MDTWLSRFGGWGMAMAVAVAAMWAVLAGSVPSTPSARPGMREISYYPRNNAWLAFWEDWPETTALEMDADLDAVAGLGANTVRIFLHPDVMGYPAPQPSQLDNLEQALQLIADHGLTAHLTLFDCWWGWEDLDGSRTWLEAIVGPHQDDARVALWELQNEVDLDNALVRAWVGELFPELKEVAGSVPCTVSVNRVDWLTEIEALTAPATPDIYSLHWYPSSTLSWTAPLAGDLRRARRLVAGSELLLGEFGFPTHTFSEAVQASLYRDVLYHTRVQGIRNLGAWTLYDFPSDTQICGQPPAWETEWHYGLYREDGCPKAAAAVLRAAFEGSPIPWPGAPSVFNGSFEEATVARTPVDDWSTWDPDWSDTEWIAREATVAYDGVHALAVRGVPTMTVGAYQPIGVAVASHRRYTLTGYARPEALTGEAWLALSWFDAEERWLGQDTRSPPLTGTDASAWHRLTIVEAVPPQDAAYVQVFLQMAAGGAGERVWFDAVSLTQTGLRPPLSAYLPIIRAE